MNVMKIFTLLLIIGLCTNIQAMFVSDEIKLLNGNISVQEYLNNIARDEAGWGEYAYKMQIIKDINYSLFSNDYYKNLINTLLNSLQTINLKPNRELYLKELTKTLIENAMRRVAGNTTDPIAEGQLIDNIISPEYYLKLIENDPYTWGSFSTELQKIRLTNYRRIGLDNLYLGLINMIKENINEMKRLYPYRKTEMSQIGSLEKKILENIDDSYNFLKKYKEKVDISRGG